MSRLIRRAYIPTTLLFLLSLLECSTVLTRDLLPAVDVAALPPMQHLAMTLGCFGLIAASAAILCGARRPSLSNIRQASLTSLTLFAIPASLSALASRYIPPLTVAAIETLAPLFCILLEPYLASPAASLEEASQPRYGILPALAAFSGVLLIFPFFVPSTYPAALGFACAFLAALSLGAGYCLAVRTAAEHPSLLATAAIISLSAALILATLSILLERPRLHRSTLNAPTILLFATELLALALLFWLTRRLSATSLATRALWTLLLPILIEAAALSIPLSARNWIGLALMASGSGIMLLSAKDSSHPPGLFTKER